jgi:hypothetical protein
MEFLGGGCVVDFLETENISRSQDKRLSLHLIILISTLHKI